MPPVFRTRIKRLIDIDRGGQFGDEGPTAQPHAFADVLPGAQGQDIAYSAFDVFCLAIGLDLLDAGFKQAEVVLLLRHIRTVLAQHFAHVMRNPPAPRQFIGAEHRPGCPTFVHNGVLMADCSVYMVIKKVELREIFPLPKNTVRISPLILEPRFCLGRDQLHSELDTLDFGDRKWLVMEIAEMAVMLMDLLQEAPLKRRGRQ